VDANDYQIRPSERVVVPENNVSYAGLPESMSFENEGILEFTNPTLATTMSWRLGAGFYSSFWGPLPYAFGPIPPERYFIMRANGVR
jgi:hypothetical protein